MSTTQCKCDKACQLITMNKNMKSALGENTTSAVRLYWDPTSIQQSMVNKGGKEPHPFVPIFAPADI